MSRRSSGSPPPTCSRIPAGPGGAGHRARYRTVDGEAAGPVQPGLRQQLVPRPAAVFQMAGRGRRVPQPDGQARPAEGHRPAHPGVHQRRTIGPSTGMRGPTRTFAQRRDTAIIAVFRATGIRLAELAAIRYDPEDAHRSDIDLWQREITVCGKGGKTRIVRFGHQASPEPGPLPSPPRPARPGAAATVARDQQPGAADRQQYLPDHRLAGRQAGVHVFIYDRIMATSPASPAATRPQLTQPRQAPYRAHGRSGRFRTSLAASAACA